MAIRPVRRDEAASLREIRLRALGDAPQAYFASLESEEGLPLSYWEDWATSEDKVVFVAEEDGSWLGMAGAFVHPDKRGTVSLWWLWLAPSAPPEPRRRLVDARANWARERGAVRLELAVAENNGAAIALHRSLGFVPTGERRSMASDPTRVGIFMARPL
jgi:ribosomal protein S18 acetylase RimI-like enzyme